MSVVNAGRAANDPPPGWVMPFFEIGALRDKDRAITPAALN
jgi:hypothetical protein